MSFIKGEEEKEMTEAAEGGNRKEKWMTEREEWIDEGMLSHGRRG